ncbi:unnamed protein product [Rhizoctonia solani]|uniref:BZIP domain-containing protein n=3 Tax=Rhizoctonia solani TaxID=456999 RepID=A0A8H2WEK6_9AGAM|nr:Hap4 for-binding to Hap2/3/5 Hap4-Hap-bind: minimal-binding domain protein [Rhizoctonia solani AG-3 Rhs1AP]KEP53819.1 Hap4 for-binding to Hap2/3/5 Hap4-Hap-bind: minimal-binding domain protein [Rhizoctonia solani 123E]CAE6377863.1 unnamed protein product [Rhizoctonia solani]CAE6413223.1 unnamed protein product [Rhizoctonia solani]
MATLYAQPSKEWVIPAKPKPGRKPKRDDPVVDEDAASDSKAKKVQNRAAQRAFRERKQSQLADLQARLAQYEQGEIERNVALQNVAKKLKEDNERLKSENEKLREESGKVREENLSVRNRLRELQEEYLAYRRKMEPNAPHLDLESAMTTRKRSRADSDALSFITSAPSPSSSAPTPPASKRKRSNDETRSSTPTTSTGATSATEPRRTGSKSYTTLPPDYAPPPQLLHVYSPAASEGSSRPSLVMSPASSENSAGPEPPSLDEAHLDEDDIMQGYPNDKHDDSEYESTFPESEGLHIIDCGFCSREPGSCVCREVSAGINQLLESASSSRHAEIARATLGDASHEASTSTASKPSILDNLPPVQPGVPLRLRRSKRKNPDAALDDSGPVHLTPVPQFLKPTPTPSARPVCSGDPSNCAACADDPFGRAFCTALASGGVCREPNCKRCPKSMSDLPRAEPTVKASEDKGKGKGKAISMDIEAGSSSAVGLGMGMGMSMETGMLLCCGDPKLCGGGICGVGAPSSPVKSPQRPLIQTSSSLLSIHPQSDTRSVLETEDEQNRTLVRLPPIFTRESSDMAIDSDLEMPTNEAWERLKSHPNVAFADLSLLADVVAGRTKCTSSRVRLSLTPEQDTGRYEHDNTGDFSESLEGDSEQHSLRSHPTLVPQDALVRCGRERLMRVQAEGVRDALAMLDVQRTY